MYLSHILAAIYLEQGLIILPDILLSLEGDSKREGASDHNGL